MEIRRLSPDEAAVRRFLEELMVPYNRELEAIVEAFALDDDVDYVESELDYRMDFLDSEGSRAWVAVDGVDGDDVDLATVDADFAGFVMTDVDESPPVFDRPDRLVICELYVTEPYRGTGLARELMDRAREDAEDADCGEVVLSVDVDNGRALAFYEKLGFEPIRHRMAVDVDEMA